MNSHVHCSFIHNIQGYENTVSTDRWKDKEDVAYTDRQTYIYNAILFSVKEEGNPAICDNMYELGWHHAK